MFMRQGGGVYHMLWGERGFVWLYGKGRGAKRDEGDKPVYDIKKRKSVGTISTIDTVV